MSCGYPQINIKHHLGIQYFNVDRYVVHLYYVQYWLICFGFITTKVQMFA